MYVDGADRSRPRYTAGQAATAAHKRVLQLLVERRA
jgi:hypothetical protein